MGTDFKLLFLPEEILIEVNLHNCQALAPNPCSLNPNQAPSGLLGSLQDFSVSSTISVRKREREFFLEFFMIDGIIPAEFYSLGVCVGALLHVRGWWWPTGY